MRVQWYLSTSENPRDKRQSYKLLPEINYLDDVRTVIQEEGLAFRHEGRSGSAAESTLDDDQHDRIMSHNFASYS